MKKFNCLAFRLLIVVMMIGILWPGKDIYAAGQTDDTLCEPAAMQILKDFWSSKEKNKRAFRAQLIFRSPYVHANAIFQGLNKDDDFIRCKGNVQYGNSEDGMIGTHRMPLLFDEQNDSVDVYFHSHGWKKIKCFMPQFGKLTVDQKLDFVKSAKILHDDADHSTLEVSFDGTKFVKRMRKFDLSNLPADQRKNIEKQIKYFHEAFSGGNDVTAVWTLNKHDQHVMMMSVNLTKAFQGWVGAALTNENFDEDVHKFLEGTANYCEVRLYEVFEDSEANSLNEQLVAILLPENAEDLTGFSESKFQDRWLLFTVVFKK